MQHRSQNHIAMDGTLLTYLFVLETVHALQIINAVVMRLISGKIANYQSALERIQVIRMYVVGTDLVQIQILVLVARITLEQIVPYPFALQRIQQMQMFAVLMVHAQDLIFVYVLQGSMAPNAVNTTAMVFHQLMQQFARVMDNAKRDPLAFATLVTVEVTVKRY